MTVEILRKKFPVGTLILHRDNIGVSVGVTEKLTVHYVCLVNIKPPYDLYQTLKTDKWAKRWGHCFDCYILDERDLEFKLKEKQIYSEIKKQFNQ